MSGHTAGPWVVGVSHDGQQFMVVGDDGEVEVAFVAPLRELRHLSSDVQYATGDEKANARLIAAAPEMLEAPKKAQDALEQIGKENPKDDHSFKAWIAVSAAIATTTEGV